MMMAHSKRSCSIITGLYCNYIAKKRLLHIAKDVSFSN